MKIRMFVSVVILTLSAVLVISGCSQTESKTDAETKSSPQEETAMTTATAYTEIPFNTIDGEEVSLADFQGKAVLMVNTASKCGYTTQYEGLEKLYREKKDDGLVVIGFPANNFGNQEPGTNEEIMNFCQTNFGVTFPMMAKISVKGDDIHPLYAYLTEKSSESGEIKWNFTKFLIDREGNVVARFEPNVKPESEELMGKVDQVLTQEG